MQEYARRFAIWLDNVEFIHSFNEEGKSFWVSLKLSGLKLHIEPERYQIVSSPLQLGLNHFADWTHEEFQQHALGYRPELKQESLGQTYRGEFRYHDTVAPKEIDWVEKGAVTAVKNQAQVSSSKILVSQGHAESCPLRCGS